MKRRRARGFSLLEALVAIALFGLVASAVGTLVSHSLLSTIRNRHSTAAALLAQQTLEGLRGLEYDEIVGGATTEVVAGQSYGVNTAVVANSPASGMKAITVTVTWNGPEGTQSYAIQTIFTNIVG